MAYAKGERYRAGERTGDLIGKTGLWLFSTDGVVASDNLLHHLAHIVSILVPGPTDVGPLAHLHALLTHHKGIRADLSCFWHGRFEAKRPSIPRAYSEFLKVIPADLALDFDTDSQAAERRRA
jgi:hypothetical protein